MIDLLHADVSGLREGVRKLCSGRKYTGACSFCAGRDYNSGTTQVAVQAKVPRTAKHAPGGDRRPGVK